MTRIRLLTAEDRRAFERTGCGQTLSSYVRAPQATDCKGEILYLCRVRIADEPWQDRPLCELHKQIALKNGAVME